MENLKSSGAEAISPTVALVQFAPLLGNIESNINSLDYLLKAVKADIIVLPELASTGYAFPNRSDAFQCAESVDNSSYIRFLTSQAASLHCFIVSGFNERDENNLYNSAILVGPSGLIGKYRKIHLFWNESDIFEPGDLGLPVFEVAGLKLGLLVCFDWMFPEVWRILALKDVDLVAHPSNLVLPFCQQAVAVHALCNRFYIATANRIGSEGSLHFTGGSVLVSPLGETIIRGPAEEPFVGSHTIDLSLSRNKNITPRNTLKESRRPECYTFLTAVEKK